MSCLKLMITNNRNKKKDKELNKRNAVYSVGIAQFSNFVSFVNKFRKLTNPVLFHMNTQHCSNIVLYDFFDLNC